jgi:16S rRNA (guanine1516-N2)-methyltransferase
MAVVASTKSLPLIILCAAEAQAEAAQALARQLQLPVIFNQAPEAVTDADFVMLFSADAIALQQTGRKAPGPILAEFTEGAVDHRRKFGGGKGQMIAKAVGVKASVYPRVLDATAGLGKDSFVLATLGCAVTMLERSPIVYQLLRSGLQRASQFAHEQGDGELLDVMARMQLIPQDSQDYLQQLSLAQYPDVIYLDPMFPDRQKSADVKKDMRVFHSIVGKDEDADGLLPLALARVNYRVVVKRPRKAPFLNGQAPSYQLEGKSSRYDIYTLKKMPDAL